MLTNENEQCLNSALVKHVSLHVCKNCNELDSSKRAVNYN